MTDSLLDIQDLYVSLPPGAQRPFAVEGVTLDLQQNEILCLVGESGSGKSILGKSIMSLLSSAGISIAKGQILFHGKNVSTVSDDEMRQMRGRDIAMIFQEPMTALNPIMRIGEQISEVLEIHTSLSKQQRKERILKILDDVHLPDPEAIYGAFPHQLSGGQRQRAVIAMALILEPKIIIADEPTTALDVTTQAQILSLIKEIQAKHDTGVLFITHDFGVVAEIADRVAVMQHGKVVEFGSKDAVLNNPQHDYTRALLAAVPGLTPDHEVEASQSDISIRVENVSKTFRSGGGLFGHKKRTVEAVKNVSFTLQKGQTLGIVGESGSGKSTLARLIIRLIEADAGNIFLNDTNVRTLNRAEMLAYRPNVQMIFQDPYASLNPRHKVGRIISEAMTLFGTSTADARARAAELLNLVGMDTAATNRYPHEFSGGQRQRISIARALSMNPAFLIADEAVSALDVSIQEQVLQLLEDLQQQFQFTMLFITHNLCVAGKIADQVAVMRKGEIVEFAPTNEIFNAPKHEYTQNLLNSQPGQEWLR